MDVQKMPWDQLDGEPAAAYKRFLFYRNLGASRTLLRAIEAAKTGLPKEEPTATKGNKKRARRRSGVSGSWAQESAQWDWKARANGWDIAMLHEAGPRVCSGLIDLFIALCRTGSQLAEDRKIKEALEIWKEVKIYVTPTDLLALGAPASEPKLYEPAPAADPAASQE